MDYCVFKARLARLCERGKLSKDVKKRFSNYNSDISPSDAVFRACSDFYLLFCEGQEASELTALGECMTELIDWAKTLAPECLYSDYDGVKSYIRLLVRASTIAQKDALITVSEFNEQFHKSLQNIKFGLPLF